MPAAVFLDRDGTVIRDAHYLSDPRKIRLLPGAAAALQKLSRAGFALILVSNQSGVARGFFDEATARHIQEAVVRRLQQRGVELTAWYYCPHLPEAVDMAYRIACDCRKPAPGMLLQAAREHDIDLARSYMIGDKADDVEAGQAAGCTSIRVGPAYRTLPQAVEWILQRGVQARTSNSG